MYIFSQLLLVITDIMLQICNGCSTSKEARHSCKKDLINRVTNEILTKVAG